MCAISERGSLIPLVNIESEGVIKMRKERRAKGAGGRCSEAREGTLSH